MEIPFQRDLTFTYGAVAQVSPMIRRVIAENPSPFTFHGTGTYIVGSGKVAVIDPGPDLDSHVQALIQALKGETVTHILITHTHRDHSPAARALQEATGAPTYGYGPHGGSAGGDKVEEGADYDFTPDEVIRDGTEIAGVGWTFEAVHTPGHTSNHICFALREESALFPGDHVMGWSTTVVSPPDGDMRAYMDSLRKLMARDDKIYWPTHGAAIEDPPRFLEALYAHREDRERQILECIRGGTQTIPEMVAIMYAAVPERLHRAAGRSVLSHLIKMRDDGLVSADGPALADARFTAA